MLFSGFSIRKLDVCAAKRAARPKLRREPPRLIILGDAPVRKRFPGPPIPTRSLNEAEPPVRPHTRFEPFLWDGAGCGFFLADASGWYAEPFRTGRCRFVHAD